MDRLTFDPDDHDEGAQTMTTATDAAARAAKAETDRAAAVAAACNAAGKPWLMTKMISTGATLEQCEKILAGGSFDAVMPNAPAGPAARFASAMAALADETYRRRKAERQAHAAAPRSADAAAVPEPQDKAAIAALAAATYGRRAAARSARA